MLKLLTTAGYFAHLLIMEENKEGGGGGGTDGSGAEGGDKAGAEGENKQGAEGGADDGGEGTGESLLDGEDGEGAEGDPVDFSKGKPEGFPDEAWDEKEKKPKSDVLFKKWQEAETRAKGLRDKLAKGEGKPPKDAKEYSFKPSEKSAKLFGDGDASKDPLVQAVGPIAKKYNLTKEQYTGFMGEISDKIAEMVEAKSGEEVAELTEEQKTEIRTREYAKIGTNAKQIIKAVESFGRELKNSGQFSEDDLKAFKSMAMTGDQVRVLNKLRAIAGGGNNINMDISDDGLPSDNEIAELQAKVKSQADQDKIDQLFEKRRRAGRPERLQITA